MSKRILTHVECFLGSFIGVTMGWLVGQALNWVASLF